MSANFKKSSAAHTVKPHPPIKSSASSSSGTIKLLTVAQAAEALAMSQKTLWRRIAAKEIVVIRDERIVRIALTDLAFYIATHRSV